MDITSILLAITITSMAIGYSIGIFLLMRQGRLLERAISEIRMTCSELDGLIQSGKETSSPPNSDLTHGGTIDRDPLPLNSHSVTHPVRSSTGLAEV